MGPWQVPSIFAKCQKDSFCPFHVTRESFAALFTNRVSARLHTQTSVNSTHGRQAGDVYLVYDSKHYIQNVFEFGC